MNTGMSPSTRWLLLGALMLSPPLGAQESADDLQIHAVGTWFYGKNYGATNPYKGIGPEGTWENLELNLNLSKPIAPKVDAVFQVRLRSQELDNTRDARIDLAQLSWRPNDTFLFRAGRLKQPWGLYAEEWRAATARPFFDVPYAMYSPLNITLPAVDGAAVTYRHPGALDLTLDLYVGQMSGESVVPGYANGAPVVASQRIPSSWRDLIGGRLSLGTNTVRGGLNYVNARRLSYDFRPVGPLFDTDPASQWGLFAAVNHQGWWLRGEYQTFLDAASVSGVPTAREPLRSWYVEGARRLGVIQLGVRRSYINGRALGTIPGSDGDWSRDTEVSASYHLSSNAVVRASHTWSRGRSWQQYSQEQLDRGLASGQWEPASRYFQVGVQFGF